MNRLLKALGATGAALAICLGIAWAAPGKNQALVYNRTSSLTAGADALPSDIAADQGVSILRFWVVPKTTSIVTVVMDDGTTEIDGQFNSGTAVTANTLAVYDAPAIPGYTYNVEFGTTQSSGFGVIFVQEIKQ